MNYVKFYIFLNRYFLILFKIVPFLSFILFKIFFLNNNYFSSFHLNLKSFFDIYIIFCMDKLYSWK